MKNGYDLLTVLTSTLNNNESLINMLIANDKETFVQNNDYILIGISLIYEIKEIIKDLNDDIFILNSNLYNLLSPILNYANNLLNPYKFVNAYKLYDALKIDVVNLKTFLNRIEDYNDK